MMAVYSDDSYAPGGGRSFGDTMAQISEMPVARRASKQPVLTLSVVEAELYEGCSAVQWGLGVSTLLSELDLHPVMHLRIDNAAPQGLASEAPASWKTRHLWIRARFVRQEVAAQRLVISHMCGSWQMADLGTKAFDLPKFKALLDLWQVIPCTPNGSQCSFEGFEGDQSTWTAAVRSHVPMPCGGCLGREGSFAVGWFGGVLFRDDHCPDCSGGVVGVCQEHPL